MLSFIDWMCRYIVENDGAPRKECMGNMVTRNVITEFLVAGISCSEVDMPSCSFSSCPGGWREPDENTRGCFEHGN